MSDTLTTLKELAAQVRGATRKGENTAERVGRLFVGILALMEESEISFEPSEGYDTLGTLKELAAQVRSATEDSENTAERVGRVFAGILDLLEQSGIEFDTAEGKSEPQPFLPFVFQNLVEQLIKNALALVKGSLYLLIVGGVGHMLHNEEQVIAVFSVCTRITAVTES